MNDTTNKLRLIKIIEILRSETDDEHSLTTNQLIDRLADFRIQTDRRVIYKDIDFLTENGFAIEQQKVSRSLGYYMAEKQFSVAELKILIDALHAANFVTARKTDELIEKVASVGGIYKSQSLKQCDIRYNTHKHSNEHILYCIEQLSLAIREKKKVSCLVFDFNYRGSKVYRHRKKLYTLEPVALVHNEDNYYVLCYNGERGIYPRRIDRLENVNVLSDDISEEAVNAVAEANIYTDKVFKMFGGKPAQVQLEFLPSALNSVFDRFGEKQKVEKILDNRYKTTVDVEISPTFWGWIFQFVGEMKIIGPEWVVNEYNSRLKVGNEIK